MSLTYNNFKSTTVKGNFKNSDSSDGTIPADGIFDRNLTIKGNIYLGNESINYVDGIPTGYIDSGGIIKIKLNNIEYNVKPTDLCLLDSERFGLIAMRDWVINQLNLKVSELIGGSPGSLDTLYELSSALGNDPNFATTITNNISSKLSISTASSTYATITNLNTKLNLSNPTYTGYLYAPNINGNYPNSNTHFLSIAGNLSGGHGEGNFINPYFNINSSSLMAFNFSKLLSASTKSDLFKIFNNGDSNVLGILTASDFKTSSINSLNSIISALPTTYQTILLYDSIPTLNSNKMLNSGAIYNALSTYQPSLSYDNLPTINSTKLINSGNLYTTFSSYAKLSNSNTFTNTNIFNGWTNFNSGVVINNPTNNSIFGINKQPTGGDLFNVYDKISDKYLFFNNEGKFGLYSTPLNNTLWQIDNLGNINCNKINNVTSEKLSYLDATSSIQYQFNTINNNINDNYLTKVSAELTYQKIYDMSVYLTISSAEIIYQKLSDMSNYLSKSSALSTYQKISNMSTYATTANLNTTNNNLNTINANVTNLTNIINGFSFDTQANNGWYKIASFNVSNVYNFPSLKIRFVHRNGEINIFGTCWTSNGSNLLFSGTYNETATSNSNTISNSYQLGYGNVSSSQIDIFMNLGQYVSGVFSYDASWGSVSFPFTYIGTSQPSNIIYSIDNVLYGNIYTSNLIASNNITTNKINLSGYSTSNSNQLGYRFNSTTSGSPKITINGSIAYNITIANPGVYSVMFQIEGGYWGNPAGSAFGLNLNCSSDTITYKNGICLNGAVQLDLQISGVFNVSSANSIINVYSTDYLIQSVISYTWVYTRIA